MQLAEWPRWWKQLTWVKSRFVEDGDARVEVRRTRGINPIAVIKPAIALSNSDEVATAFVVYTQFLLLLYIEDTPNPNALKCVTDKPPSERPRSYFNAEQAQGDPLAEALFGIEGVTNVLIHQLFVTVCKAPEADWGPIKKSLKRVLADAG